MSHGELHGAPPVSRTGHQYLVAPPAHAVGELLKERGCLTRQLHLNVRPNCFNHRGEKVEDTFLWLSL